MKMKIILSIIMIVLVLRIDQIKGTQEEEASQNERAESENAKQISIIEEKEEINPAQSEPDDQFLYFTMDITAVPEIQLAKKANIKCDIFIQTVEGNPISAWNCSANGTSAFVTDQISFCSPRFSTQPCHAQFPFTQYSAFPPLLTSLMGLNVVWATVPPQTLVLSLRQSGPVQVGSYIQFSTADLVPLEYHLVFSTGIYRSPVLDTPTCPESPQCNTDSIFHST